MKAIVSALASASLVAFALTATGSEALTPEMILREIDTICGDTWCESDFNFEFKALTFGEHGFTLSFEMFLHPEGDEEQARFPGSCHLSDYRTPDDTSVVTENGFYLKDEFYSALTDCIQENIGEASGIVYSGLTAAKRLQICEAVFNDHFDYGYSDQELDQVCQKASIVVGAYTDGAVDYSFWGPSLSGNMHECELTNDQPQSDFAPAVESCVAR